MIITLTSGKFLSSSNTSKWAFKVISFSFATGGVHFNHDKHDYNSKHVSNNMCLFPNSPETVPYHLEGSVYASHRHDKFWMLVETNKNVKMIMRWQIALDIDLELIEW